jgi:hypothetical protein
MQYSTASPGRVFIIRLEQGDVLHESIEKLAREQSVRAAALIAVGGADRGSRLVVGPVDGQARPIVPAEHVLDDVHEICGTGTLFPGENDDPVLRRPGLAGDGGDPDRAGGRHGPQGTRSRARLRNDAASGRKPDAGHSLI